VETIARIIDHEHDALRAAARFVVKWNETQHSMHCTIERLKKALEEDAL
jgi:hypothetical protein